MPRVTSTASPSYIFSPLNSIAANPFVSQKALASSQSAGAYLYTNVQNSSSSTSSQVDDSQKQFDKEIEDKTEYLFQPWRNPLGFSVDIAFSGLFYFVFYTLLKRVRPASIDNRIRAEISKLNLPKAEIEAELAKFEKVLLGLPANKVMVAKDYIDNFYQKYIPPQEQNKLFNKIYKSTYFDQRRDILSATMAFLSLGRAFAINKDMPIPLALFIAVSPWLTNRIFTKADQMLLASNGIKTPEMIDMVSKGERNNFISKVFIKCSKRSQEVLTFLLSSLQFLIASVIPIIPKPQKDSLGISFEGVATFVIALFSSVISRGFRDFIEEGLPKTANANPIYNGVGKLGFIQKLRNSGNNFFKEGAMDKVMEKLGHKEGEPEGLKYLAKFSLVKLFNKYLTDIALFSLMGIGLLKISFFFKHLLNIHDHDNNSELADSETENTKFVDSSYYNGQPSGLSTLKVA
jgi:hypothetical protein